MNKKIPDENIKNEIIDYLCDINFKLFKIESLIDLKKNEWFGFQKALNYLHAGKCVISETFPPDTYIYAHYNCLWMSSGEDKDKIVKYSLSLEEIDSKWKLKE